MSESLPSVIEYDVDVNDAKPIPPLPPGEYPASVIGAEMQTSKNTGNRMIMVTHIVRPENYPVDFTDGDPDGTKLINYIVVEPSPKYFFAIKQACQTYGVPIRKLPNGGSRVDAQDFIGQDVLVTTTTEEYQGRVNAKIKSVRAA